MYATGSKVVHPCYGAGIIDRIKRSSIGSSDSKYYVIAIDGATGGLEVMVPVEQAADFGLRRVMGRSRIYKLIAGCTELPADDEVVSDYKKRKLIMTEWLKSGDFGQVVVAVRMLHCLSLRRPLGMTDKRFYDDGMDMLATEYALAVDVDVDDAKQQIREKLDQMAPEEDAETA